MRRRHASKSYQNELDQRRGALSQETRDRRRLAALTSKCEKFNDWLKPAEMRELKSLQAAYPACN